MISLRIEPSVVRIKINEAALNQKISNLENIAPAAAVCDSGAPRATAVHACARSLNGEGIGPGHDPVKIRVIVEDAFNETAEVGEQLSP